MAEVHNQTVNYHNDSAAVPAAGDPAGAAALSAIRQSAGDPVSPWPDFRALVARLDVSIKDFPKDSPRRRLEHELRWLETLTQEAYDDVDVPQRNAIHEAMSELADSLDRPSVKGDLNRRAANKVTNLVVALRSSRSTRTLPTGDVSWLQFIADVGTLRETADFERWEAWDDTFKPGAMIFTLDFLLNITAGAFDSIPAADRTHMHSTIFALIGLTERPCYPPWDEKKDYVGAPRWAEEVIEDVKKLMEMVEKMRADSSKTTSSPPPHKRRRIRSE